MGGGVAAGKGDAMSGALVAVAMATSPMSYRNREDVHLRIFEAMTQSVV